jgi:hypothetical protein
MFWTLGVVATVRLTSSILMGLSEILVEILLRREQRLRLALRVLYQPKMLMQ